MKNCFEFYDFENLKVCAYDTDKFKTGVVSINFIVPLEGDVSANAILPYLLSRSCKAYPDTLSLNRKLSEYYGAELIPAATKMGENHVLRLVIYMLENRFAFDGEDIALECTDLLCRLLFEPNAENGAFSADDLRREKRLAMERIDNQKNDKRTYALRRAIEIMCADENYSKSAYGTKEGIEALTPESVYEAWQKLLKTATVKVNVVGTSDAKAIGAKVESYLSKTDRCCDGVSESVVIPKAEEPKKVIEEENVKQGKLVMGFRSGMTKSDEDYAAYRVMTDIFGGGPYSRLFDNVREKQSLCYYCSARLFSSKGLIIVQSGIENENAEKTEKAVLEQLKGLADGNVTEEDLKKSKLSLTDSFNSAYDTPEDIEQWAYSQLADDEFFTPKDYVDAFNAVTLEEVTEKAKMVSLDTVYFLKGTAKGGELDD